MSKSGSALFKYTAGANASLVEELINDPNAKCTPRNIVGITKTPDGDIVWLETGNDRSGLNHILQRHEIDFNIQEVSTEEIPTFILEAVHQGNVVGHQGDRTVFEFIYEGVPRRVAVQISSNGCIVGANPKSIGGKV